MAYAKSSEVPVSNDQQAPLGNMTGEVSPNTSFVTNDENVLVPSFDLDDGDTEDIDLDLQGTTQSKDKLTDAAQMASYKRQRRAFKEHTPPKPTSSPPTAYYRRTGRSIIKTRKDDQPPHNVRLERTSD